MDIHLKPDSDLQGEAVTPKPQISIEDLSWYFEVRITGNDCVSHVAILF